MPFSGISGVDVTDSELWSEAVGQVKREYHALPSPLKQQLCGISAEIMELKGEHQKLLATFDAERLCGGCNGVCCRYGKHHFSAVELIGYLVFERELFRPSFDDPVCPYIGDSGCMMEPALRPFNCIIFICEDLDKRLDEGSRTLLEALEKRLRLLYRQFGEMLGSRFENGLLISYQRSLDTGIPVFNF
jgi:hypothetical protein